MSDFLLMCRIHFLFFISVTVQISFVFAVEKSEDVRTVLDNVGGEFSEKKTAKEKDEIWVADYLVKLTPDFWSFLPEKKNSSCKYHADLILQETAKLNLWAIKMLDASAKPPSGILNGNLNQFGDFDECLSVEGFSKDQFIKGKYCLANIQINVQRNQKINSKLKILDSTIHSHRMLTNEPKDQGHRIPRFETFNWGICIPSSCNKEELEEAFLEQIKNFSEKNLFFIDVTVDDELCYVKQDKEFSAVKLTVRYSFLAILLLIVLATIFDIKNLSLQNAKLSKGILCFSLKKSWSILTKTNFSNDDIKCLHGARFLNAVALLLSHKQIAMLFNPIQNRTEMSEGFGKPWTMIGRSAILYTDSFILFSGLLTSYSFIKDLDEKKKLNFKNKLGNRLVRLIPNLVCIILFCTYVMDSMASGPQWGLVVNKYTNLCKKHMWRNFLFVHNYFGFENMCLTHTHQLGIDMQLFLMSPIFIYLVWKLPILGQVVMIGVAAASTWLRYQVTHQEGLSTLLYYGISVERLWKTANKSYILPTHRVTVYLIGVLLGYYLRRGGKNLKLSNLKVTIGWITAIAAALLAVFGPYKASFKDYTYDPVIAAWFNAYAPLLWTAFAIWVILACINGYGGILNDFLSWKYFLVFTRLSYAVYLTQFPVFFYNVGSERFGIYYKGFHSLFDVLELIVIFIASIVVTLAFDIPFQELKKVLTKCSPKIIKEKTEDAEKDQTESIDSEKKRCDNTVKIRKRLQSFGT